MQPHISSVLDDGRALPLSLLTFTKPVTETDLELRGKNERPVLPVHSQQTFAIVYKSKKPYYF